MNPIDSVPTPTTAGGSHHLIGAVTPDGISGGDAAHNETPEPASGMTRRWQLWILVPLLLLAGIVGVVVNQGDRIIAAFGHNPPSADAFSVRRVDFEPDEVRIKVSNPQLQDLTVATVTIDDAIVPYELEGGPATIGHLGSRTIVVPYTWVEDDPYLLGITSSTGIQTTHEIPVAVERVGVTTEGLVAGAVVGTLVGFIPVLLGLLWLPALRRLDQRWLSGFMALTAGLLTFVAIDAFVEAQELQAALPGGLAGPGVLLLGISASYLLMTWIGDRFSRRGQAAATGQSPAHLGGQALAMLVAIGIGLHNLGEGLAIGSSFALGQLSFGIFLIVGFMIHNVSEGLGIAVPAADGSSQRPSVLRLVGLAAIAGFPAVLGIWLGRYITNDIVSVFFFSIAVGAAAQVIVQVVKYAQRLSPHGLASGGNAIGFVAGVAVMFVTGALIS